MSYYTNLALWAMQGHRLCRHCDAKVYSSDEHGLQHVETDQHESQAHMPEDRGRD